MTAPNRHSHCLAPVTLATACPSAAGNHPPATDQADVFLSIIIFSIFIRLQAFQVPKPGLLGITSIAEQGHQVGHVGMGVSTHGHQGKVHHQLSSCIV